MKGDIEKNLLSMTAVLTSDKKVFTRTIFRVNRLTNSILYIVSNRQIINIRINILYIYRI